MPQLTTPSKKPIIIGLVAALLVAGGVSAYVAKHHAKTADVTQNTSSVNSAADNKTSTPSPAPAAETDTKTTTPAATPTPKPPAQKPPTYAVTISSLAQSGTAINISAYSHFAHAGTCTVTFTHGASVVTKSVSSYVDAGGKNICDFPSDTRCVDTGGGTQACKEPFIKRSDFSTAGQWQTVVKFTGGGESGQSATQTLTIT